MHIIIKPHMIYILFRRQRAIVLRVSVQCYAHVPNAAQTFAYCWIIKIIINVYIFFGGLQIKCVVFINIFMDLEKRGYQMQSHPNIIRKCVQISIKFKKNVFKNIFFNKLWRQLQNLWRHFTNCGKSQL